MTANIGTVRLALLILLACTVSACDGGLFGTGDGDTTVVVDSSGSFGEGDAHSGSTTQSFENLQIGTNTTAPLIHVINVSDQTISARLDANSAELFTRPITAGTSTQASQLQLGENRLAIIDPNTSEELLAIHPLNVAASTLTTLVVRNNADQGLDIVPLRSMSISFTPTVAQLRLLQADLIADEDTPATFSLQPNGSSPGGSQISYPDLSVASSVSASYQSVSPGEYLLVDSLGRIDTETLNLQAGKIYTLIVTDRPEAAIILHEDTLLTQ